MLKGGTGMDERTMFELLEIYDAKVELQKDKELMEGIEAVDTHGEDITASSTYSKLSFPHRKLKYISRILR